MLALYSFPVFVVAVFRIRVLEKEFLKEKRPAVKRRRVKAAGNKALGHQGAGAWGLGHVSVCEQFLSSYKALSASVTSFASTTVCEIQTKTFYSSGV